MTIATDSALILFYDYYHEYNGYRYITSSDLRDWSKEVVPAKEGLEDILRHGSIVKVKEGFLQKMLEVAGKE